MTYKIPTVIDVAGFCWREYHDPNVKAVGVRFGYPVPIGGTSEEFLSAVREQASPDLDPFADIELDLDRHGDMVLIRWSPTKLRQALDEVVIDGKV